MKHRVLLALCLLISSSAHATTYYASPTGSPVGTCTDPSGNVCDLTRAEAVATHADRVIAACGTYTLGSSALTVDANITIEPATPLCATITSSNATAPVILSPANNANPLTFGEFTVSPIGGIAGSSSRGLSISDTAGYEATVILRGSQIFSGINSAINDAQIDGTTKYLNIVVPNDSMGAQGWLRSQAHASINGKKILIDGMAAPDGGVATLTQTVSGTLGVWVERSTTTPQTMWVNVRNVKLKCVTPLSLGASAQGACVYVRNVTNGTDIDGNANQPLIVENSNIAMEATSNPTGTAEGVYIFSISSAATAHNPIVRGVKCTLNSPVGACIRVGSNMIQASYVDDALVNTNEIECLFHNGSATPHGLVIGNAQRGLARGNLIKGCQAALLLSVDNGTLAIANIIIGAPYASLFAKGNTAAGFYFNAVIMDDALYEPHFGNYGCLGAAAQGATPNVATAFIGNICQVVSGSGHKFATVDPSQAATFSYNDYDTKVSLTNQWVYQGVAQTSLAAWQGARESTAYGLDPKFVGGGAFKSADDVRLMPTSPLRRLGTCYLSVGCIHRDFRGYRGFVPPDLGPFQRN